MYVAGRNRNRTPAFVAYPAPGPFPAAAIHGVWSFSATGLGEPEVTITALGAERELDVAVTFLQQGFGQNTIAMRLGERVLTGETYRVVIVSGNRRWAYETAVVACPLRP